MAELSKVGLVEEVSKAGEFSRERLLWMYEKLVAIRRFEETVAELFASGRVPGFVHLCIGEEAIAVGTAAAMRPDDYLISHHRGHGHSVAKGVEIGALFAEIMGKVTGICRGKGGSMHLADMSVNMIGANGIVGGGLSLSCGPALTSKIKGDGRITVCCFGDGASNQGVAHEAMNLASIWKLPVIFLCENNLYAESTPVEYAVSAKDIADRAIGYSMPGLVVDGMDVFAVYEAVKRAAERARAGQGPSLVECKTYRYLGHYQGDQVTYRLKEEVEKYREKDCIARFEKTVVSTGKLSEADLRATDDRVAAILEAGVKFAEESPLPPPGELYDGVYVSYPE